MSTDLPYRKKLIEVALPLDAINRESAREKSIRHGHPSTLHLWWARRPLAACRAVLFASLIDDPSQRPDLFPTVEEQEQERKRLFDLIEMMVKWENANNDELMEKVRAEIRTATSGNPPPVLDPFAGGGSIPLEAQRLGLEAHASDLNPVAVLINKALIEIPPRFAGRAPVNPSAQQSLLGEEWRGARGLAEDIRYYGKWMRDEAERRIGHLYPKVTLPKEYGGGEATVIAWLWTRAVMCPNPACGIQMPLVRSFYLSKKKGKEAWVEPEVDKTTTPPTLHFKVKTGKGKPQDGTLGRQGAICIACGNAVPLEYLRNAGKEQKLGNKLLAIVAEGNRSRVYLSPDDKQENMAKPVSDYPYWKPEQEMPANPRWFSPPLYGMSTFGDIFTFRQLVALTTFSDLVREARECVQVDAGNAGLLVDDIALNDGSAGANAYADAVATYLGMGVSRLSDICNSLCMWENTKTQVRHMFTRQAIPMLWDFAEPNVFADAAGDFGVSMSNLLKALEATPAREQGIVQQQDATTIIKDSMHFLISTDPPYYDNIGYADLSDFFYVWLRRSLNTLYPDLFKTMLVPKASELVATPYRFGGSKSKAQEFFEQGLSHAFEQMRTMQHYDYPLTVYYAFKQAEAEEDGVEDETDTSQNSATVIASTGWETMLEGLIRSGFTITGTWPIRTEMMNRSVGQGTNALASSIVLVCRPRPVDAPIASRRQFLNDLRAELADELVKMQHSGIAPVDLAQASIGPGMAIYSRYRQVVEADGTPLRVRTALQLINRTLDEVLTEQEGEYETETRWAVAWFEEYAHEEGEYGRAETLSKAKNMSLQSLVDAGLLSAHAGKVRLLRRDELPAQWDAKSPRLTIWEVMQRMIGALLETNSLNGGELGASNVLRATGEKGEIARDLAYRLYTVCERKGWANEALAYNSLVTSWSEISKLAKREASNTGLWESTFLG